MRCTWFHKTYTDVIYSYCIKLPFQIYDSLKCLKEREGFKLLENDMEKIKQITFSQLFYKPKFRMRMCPLAKEYKIGKIYSGYNFIFITAEVN